VVPCGTRNHFAKDCGADIADPAGELAAIEDGHEVRVDIRTVNGQVFLNNVSVGFYAAMVHVRTTVGAAYLSRRATPSVPSSRGGGVRRCALQYLAGSWRPSRCW
jgi:hypothetical protein